MSIRYEPKYDVVKKLKNLIEDNNWETKFKEAIDKAQEYKIKRIEHIQNIDKFLEWLDTFVEWIPYDKDGERDLYYNICEFYFFLDQEPVKSLQMYPAAYCKGVNSRARFNSILYGTKNSYLDVGSKVVLQGVGSRGLKQPCLLAHNQFLTRCL